jgi:hypothetical protein
MSKDFKPIKAPFPWFGGKSRVASLIWSNFGKVSNYIEPFAGSLAVLLGNPSIPKIETVNDIDCYLANFWRAVKENPEEVARYSDYPVSEVDLHARHRWLVSSEIDSFKEKMNNDPLYFDVKIAGWWIWGICASIPGNWLESKGLNAIPILSSAGSGIHGLSFNPLEWFKLLQSRLKRVRICCGDWSKVVTPAVSFKNKGLSPNDITAIFLDPPYEMKDRSKVYKEDSDIYSKVCEWAILNGDNSKLRIAVCGYEGYKFPDSWKEVSWQTNGGLANQGLPDSRGKINSKKEKIYFSPHCITKD